MDPEGAPLLEREEQWRARIVSLIARIVTPFTLDPWRAALDGTVMVLLMVSIVISVSITAGSSSSSPCRTMEAPVAMKVVILLLPPCFIVAVLYASFLARYAVGAPWPAALALLQLVWGVVLGEWLAICGWGFSAAVVLTVGTVVVALLVWWGSARATVLAPTEMRAIHCC